mgnify:CR=1 FL=1
MVLFADRTEFFLFYYFLIVFFGLEPLDQAIKTLSLYTLTLLANNQENGLVLKPT